ncbi:ead/Ea22-like family protein [Serratia marcescens]|uniref:ead/Ea22-like family protein n=1 Tax=Serratia marcescens TaxID=615 RepID=UPI00276F3783|nr:ead/Ea22-like family protein [Serratia marcescens]MDP8601532.1 ead/Ea22-like family protein [Serratia marcescens]MDP8686232.1 ead/Ea22-like family protein [Serratia marcescens]MDP8735809.1 ead/Ea22-like family protein [Serratia marcescens]MDP8795130.1 ead/Ea22-like family protein [Serratia marcescens]
MDKFSELKAAAMAATPGPWISGDDSWSDGDHANISTEERYDSGIINIAQVDGGGSESGFDEPFSTEQQANARYITAASPAVILDLLAELEAKDKRIAELEAKLATPVRLPRPACTYADHSYPAYSRKQVGEIITSAGMRFTVEGDEQNG